MITTINAPRHHVKMFGYTFARGMIGGIDCIWYDKDKITFESKYIETGASTSLMVVFIIVFIAFFLAVLFGLIGFILAVFFMIWSVDVWFKLFLV